MPLKVLFFIESLRSGGKERRFLELISYLKENTKIEMQVVLTDAEIHYNYARDLGIPITVIERKWLKKDPTIFFRFFSLAKSFNPDVIHTWGTMTTFYALPAKHFLKCPLVANLISDAKKQYKKNMLANIFFEISCRFSNVILANSRAGIKAYGKHASETKVIYNGVRLERFQIPERRNIIKEKLSVKTKYMLIMVASFSDRKDYNFCLDVAKQIGKERGDITFVCVGDGINLEAINMRIKHEKITNCITIGKRSDVEELVSAADIGLLFTNNKVHAEGVSNSVLEYMALAKPVITTDQYGGSSEIIEDGVSGYILESELAVVVGKINLLLADESFRENMGKHGRQIVNGKFSIERMGKEYLEVYKSF